MPGETDRPSTQMGQRQAETTTETETCSTFTVKSLPAQTLEGWQGKECVLVQKKKKRKEKEKKKNRTEPRTVMVPRYYLVVKLI